MVAAEAFHFGSTDKPAKRRKKTQKRRFKTAYVKRPHFKLTLALQSASQPAGKPTVRPAVRPAVKQAGLRNCERELQ